MKHEAIDSYKIAVIPTFGHLELEEGEIKNFGPATLYIQHLYALRDFARKYYPEILLKPGITKNPTPELYAYYLQEEGNIVIANLTHASTIEKYGKEAMIFMPEEITEKQRESLITMAEEMEDYTLFILYDFELNHNIPDSKNIYQQPDERPIELVNRYFETVLKERKK